MFTKTLIAVLATGAALVNASPAPTPVGPALAKRTTHTGEGTIFLQGGAPGSCGHVNPDSAFIGALSNFWMDDESPNTSFCGRTINVQNVGSTDNVGGEGNTVTITVADTCPSCTENHIDLSEGAWNKLTNNAEFGTIEIAWNFNA